MPTPLVRRRHWRIYGIAPLPSRAEALDERISAFQSWFMRIECDRCGEMQMINQVHRRWDGMQVCDILDRMRHDACDGQVGKRNWSPASRASVAGRCGGSCCGKGRGSARIPDYPVLLLPQHEAFGFCRAHHRDPRWQLQTRCGLINKL